MTIHLTKTELVSQLKRQIVAATKRDREAAAEHRKAEAAFLQTFRSAMRDAAKWDYQTAKSKGFDPLHDHKKLSPSWRIWPDCPDLVAPKMRRLLEEVELSNQNSYQISEDGKGRPLHWALLWTATPEPETVC